MPNKTASLVTLAQRAQLAPTGTPRCASSQKTARGLRTGTSRSTTPSSPTSMQRGRWRSYTVFMQFYNRSKRHTQQCNAVLGLNPAGGAPVPVQPVGRDRAQNPPRFQRRAAPLPAGGDIQVKPPHNDGAGKQQVPAGPGGPITQTHHCFACEDPDDDSLIWCQQCNKHLHVRHFRADPDTVMAQLASDNWQWWCTDCE